MLPRQPRRTPRVGTIRCRAKDAVLALWPGAEPERYERLRFAHFFLQPMDGPERSRDTTLAVAYCRSHPRWRLSVQMHKLIGIP